MSSRSVAPLCCLASLCAACAVDEPPPRFYGGTMDAQVDAMVASDAGADAALQDAAGPPDAAPPISPGAETGRLAGITALHNAARARVQASPALAPLRWSSEVALVAQAYAETLAARCLEGLPHSDASTRQSWGENLASFGISGGDGREPTGTAQSTVDLWASELDCYTFGPFQSGVNETCTAACERYGGCGHYTQMVWRATERLGCGVADCQSGTWRKSYWVCNYDPPGNYRGQLPY
jgi:pathogenesis-related protein 1